MKLTPVRDKSLITQVTRKTHYSNLSALIDEFIASGEMMVEVDNSGYSQPSSCTNVINNAIRNRHVGGVCARTYNGKTYVYRTDLENNEVETQNCSTK